MSLFGKLFGGGAAPEAKPEDHNGFRIFPEPEKASGGYRIGARIEKDVGGETKSHLMIRADVCNSLDEATSISINKAKMLIDQMGDGIFG